MKAKAKIELSVLILFHARVDHFAQVWEEVKKARPSRLFLYQDGPRGERDMAGIMACRSLVADDQIDWECEVHRNYQERNLGCDPAEYYSQRWAFSLTDKCVVLEDDDVPSQSFFLFCKEMLDRYADDPRVTMIAGFNTDEVTPNVESDYFFTNVFSIWGWASWSRVINKLDDKYTWLDDAQAVALMEQRQEKGNIRGNFLQMCRDHRALGIPYYETILWSHMILNNGLAIMPARNLVNNVGMDGGTHYGGASLQTTPRALRRIFTMKRHELTWPLRHPKYVCEWMPYKDSCYRTNAWGHPWIKLSRSVEELFLNLRYGNFSTIRKAIANRINKIWGRYRYR